MSHRPGGPPKEARRFCCFCSLSGEFTFPASSVEGLQAASFSSCQLLVPTTTLPCHFTFISQPLGYSSTSWKIVSPDPLVTTHPPMLLILLTLSTEPFLPSTQAMHLWPQLSLWAVCFFPLVLCNVKSGCLRSFLFPLYGHLLL